MKSNPKTKVSLLSNGVTDQGPCQIFSRECLLHKRLVVYSFPILVTVSWRMLEMFMFSSGFISTVHILRMFFLIPIFGVAGVLELLFAMKLPLVIYVKIKENKNIQAQKRLLAMYLVGASAWKMESGS